MFNNTRGYPQLRAGFGLSYPPDFSDTRHTSIVNIYIYIYIYNVCACLQYLHIGLNNKAKYYSAAINDIYYCH